LAITDGGAMAASSGATCSGVKGSTGQSGRGTGEVTKRV
jgi:hypothetical protein